MKVYDRSIIVLVILFLKANESKLIPHMNVLMGTKLWTKENNTENKDKCMCESLNVINVIN